MGNSSKRYKKEFKIEIAKLVVEMGRSVPHVAAELGLSENSVYRWAAEYRENKDNAFPGSGKIRPKDEEIRALKSRVAELEESYTVLEKFSDYLRKPREERFAFIHANRMEFPVGKMCKVLKVSQNGYITWLERTKNQDGMVSPQRGLLQEMNKGLKTSRGLRLFGGSLAR